MRIIAAALASALVSTLVPAAAEPIQIGGATTLHSDVLGEDRLIFVRVPPNYEGGRNAYPVLYLTDARAQFLHTVATVEFLARNGRMPEMIVVGITNTDRTRDLTPTRADMTGRDGTVFPMPTSGGADAFLRFIETELVPWVEGQFRTEPFRVFAGHSFGGLFAVHALTSRPDLFDAVIAVSPTLTWDDQLPVRRFRELLAARKRLDTTFVFTLGDEGSMMQEGFDALQRLLKKTDVKGFRWDALQMRDEDHGSVVLLSHYAALRKVFDGWSLPRDPETGEVPGGLDGIRQHYRKLSERYGFTVHPSEDMINSLGYGLLAEKKLAEAIEAFELNVEVYPESPNVHDSLGEALEKSGNLEAAREHYARATELGDRQGDANRAVFRRNLERVERLLAGGTVEGEAAGDEGSAAEGESDAAGGASG